MTALSNPTRLPAALLLLVLLAGLSACEEEKRLPTVSTEIPFRTDGVLDFLRPDGSVITRIAVEIAETPEARATGLMGRRGLPERGGMLFLFEEPDTLSFWMRNTPLPLDMIFVGADLRVVNIEKRTSPYTDDFHRSTAPAQYVVEVRAGFTDRAGIDETTRIRWRRTDPDRP